MRQQRRFSKKPITSFQRKVYEAVRKIPRGRVAAYQRIAYALGKLGAARAVGNALNKNPFRSVPCHRVVRSDGSVGGYARGRNAKITLLRSEGVRVDKGRVSASFFFAPHP